MRIEEEVLPEEIESEAKIDHGIENFRKIRRIIGLTQSHRQKLLAKFCQDHHRLYYLRVKANSNSKTPIPFKLDKNQLLLVTNQTEDTSE